MWLCNNNSEFATLHCEKTGPRKIRQIVIISRGLILDKYLSVPDSLSAGSASDDNSDINTWSNQLCISLVIKIWDVITTVKTYLHFILFLDWKWMSLEILTVQTDFDTVCNLSPCTLLMSSCRETPVHQQPASWLVFKNVKWSVVHDVYVTLQPLNKRRYMVNHYLLIRSSLIYRFTLD